MVEGGARSATSRAGHACFIVRLPCSPVFGSELRNVVSTAASFVYRPANSNRLAPAGDFLLGRLPARSGADDCFLCGPNLFARLVLRPPRCAVDALAAFARRGG